MTNFTTAIDAIALTELHRSGATKWCGDDETIGAFVAEMDFNTAPEIKAALHAAVDEGAFGYLPGRLRDELQNATAEFYARRFGWSFAASDVHHVPDVIKALQLAIEHHSAPDSPVIVPTPAYMPFLVIPPMQGRKVIQVPMAVHDDGYATFDLDGLQKAFDQGANLLALCNPYNPLGRVFSREELVAVSEVVARNNGRVFADEIWAPLVYDGHAHIPYASVNDTAAGHTITAASASKAWNLPGLKCAQVITSNDADREIWSRIGFFAGHGTSNLGAVSNIAAYRDGERWLGEVLAYLDRNRAAISDLVAQHLPGVRYRQPEGTYVAWLDMRGLDGIDNPAEFFKEHAQVHLTDGASCGKGFEGFARFIFATPLPILREAFERMGKALRER
ncbi:aminotransferase class I/II-fold pyridoxal phosphate-dependent enzyme [Aurantiacibacter xanthus]|uniref:cysteine-S-conjugate beta-lyase n=1 Tax=Aurantiacibacter xanthus TaxID=1784712 RepID=A0A3A1P1N6_9SPHN|nr:aminotransferase class I/II-fold pyridoxal phosphate-dependent enzyme [Aurantiacibacter xanthus]RIV82624.1 aminotransferase class I/II-fold pyridoxal phosphate-dependent enzyme [Aurantiacibacter xanthus]